MFKGLRRLSSLAKKIELKDVDRWLDELELILLSADVSLDVVEDIKADVKRSLADRTLKRGEKVGDVVEETLKRAVRAVLLPGMDLDAVIAREEKPVIILFVGVNGTGKTTTIAKIAHRLKSKRCVVAASDTFRAGAIEQLETHASRIGVELIKHSSGGDPAAVAYDAVQHARARHKDVVLIDTAGRMQTNRNLMEQMQKLKRVAKPQIVLYVGDALTGNDAVQQAKQFDEAVGIDGVILTKIDADAKGGAALSISHAIGKPIAYLSAGQGYDDLFPFDRDWMVNRLFGES